MLAFGAVLALLTVTNAVGQSLSGEYVRSDSRTLTLRVGAENFFPISFFADPGRTYGVRSSETLEGGANWIYVPKSDASAGFYRVTVE